MSFEMLEDRQESKDLFYLLNSFSLYSLVYPLYSSSRLIRVNFQFIFQLFTSDVDAVFNGSDGNVQTGCDFVVFKTPEMHHKRCPVRIIQCIDGPVDIVLCKRRIRGIVGATFHRIDVVLFVVIKVEIFLQPAVESSEIRQG